MKNQWYLRAACRDNPEFVDFPSLKQTRQISKSKAICRVCPVKKECWADAYTHNIDEGIFGGALPHEREMMGALLNISPFDSFENVLGQLRR